MLTPVRFLLKDEEIARRKAYLEIGPEDELRLREAHPLLGKHADEISLRFYEYLLAHDHTRSMLSAPGLLDRLKGLQAQYFRELTAGDYGTAYFENRLKVGFAHQRVGLSPEWYLGAYNRYLTIVGDVLSRAYGRDYERYFQTTVSLTKIVYLDMSLALDAYITRAQEALADKNAQLETSHAELHRLTAAKKQLTDMIVHDLQNPLAGIMAFLRHLNSDPGRLSESEREALVEALRRCDDLSQMILNVLQVSRAEAGKLAIYIENVDLARLARECAAGFDLSARQGGRTLEIRSPDPFSWRTDQSLFRRIVDNLVRNALRHTPRGTAVVVELRPAEAGLAELRVTDDGPGIPLEAQPHLFEAFGSSHLRRLGLHVDSGLGLAFCRAAMEALGGKISIESDGRRGTTFCVRFPRGA